MSNYNYFEHNEADLINRFDNLSGEPFTGVEEWKRYIKMLLDYIGENWLADEWIQLLWDEIKKISEGERKEFDRDYWEQLPIDKRILIVLLQKLRSIKQPLLNDRCPRLFISHRQVDWLYALRIAHIAVRQKFEYWLDIHDPLLHLASASFIPTQIRPYLIACIIEMALLNCTHVICCLTPNSRGSLWQPYEYGRVTKIPGFFKRAGAWCHPNLQQADFPEYMYLGEVFKNRKDIKDWLIAELRLLGKSNCPSPESNFIIDNIFENDTEEMHNIENINYTVQIGQHLTIECICKDNIKIVRKLKEDKKKLLEEALLKSGLPLPRNVSPRAPLVPKRRGKDS